MLSGTNLYPKHNKCPHDPRYYLVSSFSKIASRITKGLPCAVSTIHSQIRPSHEAAPIAQHKEHRGPELISCAQPIQHVIPNPLRFQTRLLKSLLRRGCADIARRERVNSDQGHTLSRTPLRCQRSCQLLYCSFGGVISRRVDTLDVSLLGQGYSEVELAYLVRYVATHTSD